MSTPVALDTLPPVVAFKELQQILGLGRTWTNLLVRESAFPRPIAVLGVGKIWSTSDVVAYCQSTGRQIHPVTTAG